MTSWMDGIPSEETGLRIASLRRRMTKCNPFRYFQTSPEVRSRSVARAMNNGRRRSSRDIRAGRVEAQWAGATPDGAFGE